MGSNVMAVFLDEYLFMNPKAFPSIFPTTATGALLVMTSSMSPDGASTAMRLIDVKNDDGTPVVTKYNWVQACTDCKRKKTPEKCNHFVAPPQHFQNFASQSRLAKLMSGIEGAYEREMQNICDEPTHRPAFNAEHLECMIRNHHRLLGDQKHLFITVDPSCGKNGNLYVLTSMVFNPLDGVCTVCLLHSLRVALLPLRHGVLGQLRQRGHAVEEAIDRRATGIDKVVRLAHARRHRVQAVRVYVVAREHKAAHARVVHQRADKERAQCGHVMRALLLRLLRLLQEALGVAVGAVVEEAKTRSRAVLARHQRVLGKQRVVVLAVLLVVQQLLRAVQLALRWRVAVAVQQQQQQLGVAHQVAQAPLLQQRGHQVTGLDAARALLFVAHLLDRAPVTLGEGAEARAFTSFLSLLTLHQIIGAENCNTANSAVVAKTLKAHIEACKSEIRELRFALPIIIPESNMAMALDLQYQLKTVMGVNCNFMTEDNDKASAQPFDMPGSQTTAKNKPVMVRLFRQYLEQRRVVFHSDFVTTQVTLGRSVQKEFIQQLRNFAEILVIREGPDGAPVTRTYYTGKVAGGNDDYVITAVLGPYMYQIFMQKDKYKSMH